MRIAVIGTGRVGKALGGGWASAGHEVVFGSRDPSSDTVQAMLTECDGGVSAASWADAVADSEIVIYAAPWPAAEEILTAIGGAAGKTLVDCTNPLNASFDGLDLGFSESAAERIAEWAPDAKVVKAFNSVSSATMADPNYGGQSATLFLCGDDAASKETVSNLAAELGLEPVDAGPLKNARYLEPFAMLYIHLAMNGWGSQCAFKIMKR